MKRDCCYWSTTDLLYAYMYNNRYSASTFPYKRTIMLDMLTYISTSSPIVDCFPESTITLNVELINDQLITLVSTLFTCLTLKTTPSLHVYCLCT